MTAPNYFSELGFKLAMIFAAAAAGVLAMSLIMPAHAQGLSKDQGFYGSLRAGKDFVGDMDYSNPGSNALSLSPDAAFSLGAGLGYRFGNGFRTELDLGFLHADIDGTYNESVVAIPCGETQNRPCLSSAVDGSTRAWSAFAMGYYDFPVSAQLVPYVGAGIGVIRHSLDVEANATYTSLPAGEYDLIDGGDTVLGYRLGAGLAYDLGMAQLDVGYTYTTADRSNFDARGSAVQAFGFAPRLKSHSVKAGLRIPF